ncbi:cell wall-associated hydrolase, invasion-associated protein [Sanguibacter keddieii DSM 10542]|uniref:Cell wall-associated hydrolase, invasion-associated protein n=1 Tax=Sanguibacter keddieii (strain ATCC 51767 / DSM 10542 / NCFB 3025 / ST-74) TaxID=446469 RepID=D1BCI7_SANKS|nr:C40 family peptidase [Sanguibacter keddieii]ACZ22974.1 cell wall-associated hydrolase, invasion-associated protein [Sanguibacter keddieii DSM 10542]
MAPLSSIATAATGNAATVGRRTALVAASSGLIVSLMGATSASAAPLPTDASVSTVDVTSLKAEARAALSTAPAVTVAADASWTVEQIDMVVTPAPEPEPEPEPVRAPAAASRTAERTSIATDTQTETEAAAPVEVAAEAPVEAAAAVPASASGSAVLDIAGRYVGVPYVSGGASPDGFDCSGFTQYVFAQLGINLPRQSGAQAQAGTVVSREDAQPGDLIASPGHIAIYAGGNSQIDAPRPGKSIQFREIWQTNPTFIRIG